ncbi:hypothetical protein [Mucilaginibacter sp.]|uniref:hypothetical protein n=1 Tax=Mucilaginibacter sp. TaxID=1882438 RepID=UPI003D0F1491
MHKAKIKLVFKQVIDASADSGFEKAILNASYQEFLLKSQAYNLNCAFKTFSDIKANDGRSNSLHYKLGFSVGHFISRLNNNIPLLKDNLGNKISFETMRFELIESHMEDIAQHKVALNYETGFFTLVEVMGEYMLLTKSDLNEYTLAETFILRMQPDLSIISYHEVAQPQLV